MIVMPLQENSVWEFRVKAVNSAGPGEPSQPTEPVTVQESPGIQSEWV